MNRDRIEGKWKELRGKVREHWGKLTDDDLDRIAGKRDQLVGRLQERYGWARDQVDREVKQFEDSVGSFEPEDRQAARGADGHPDAMERANPARASQGSAREEPSEGRTRRRA